ncbi:hypothetical protein C7M84_001366 [Penaeus vannamei]|uniref:Uncharacterized protein n=1 Tax=Penaeus vannamei TaxID=6689 RepID=A0A3R7MDQ9_PENVA|nr:hypothetical protein C7M84_001366 [Penaeus vannamei]
MESVTMPNYSYVFKFEEDFDTLEKRRWMRENWMMCFYYIGAYMIVIYGGQLYMQTRPRFELRIPLFMWNVFLRCSPSGGPIAVPRAPLCAQQPRLSLLRLYPRTKDTHLGLDLTKLSVEDAATFPVSLVC